MKVINYLIDNKEWLFSGVGIAIFAGGFALFKILFENKKISRHDSCHEKIHPVEHNVPLKIKTSENKSTNNAKIPRSGKKNISPSNVKNISNITVKEIIDEIHKLPPFQQESAVSNYNGMLVKWSGKLWSIENVGYPNMNENLVKVIFHPHSENFHYRVLLNADITEYPELKVIKRDSEITAVGEIIYCSAQGMYVEIDPDLLKF